jgi:hypothetical protein
MKKLLVISLVKKGPAAGKRKTRRRATVVD